MLIILRHRRRQRSTRGVNGTCPRRSVLTIRDVAKWRRFNDHVERTQPPVSAGLASSSAPSSAPGEAAEPAACFRSSLFGNQAVVVAVARVSMRITYLVY